MVKTLPIGKAKARFAECVRQAESGDAVVLTRHGRPVARLVAIDDSSTVPTASGTSADKTPSAPRAGAVHEAAQPYGTAPEEAPRTVAVAESRRAALRRLLEESVWPRIPDQQLGKRIHKREREEILGLRDFGSQGV